MAQKEQKKEVLETEFVLVETVESFRMRYVVEVPKGKTTWASDTVVMKEAKEFSQKYLGETILSERVVTKKEIEQLVDQDNDYISSWSKQKKYETFVTSMGDYKK